ncbi:Ig-like domain-containing protein [Desulfobacter postgatei]|uniref:Ig-like domain-containing surface protein n=1 Tax=Desulfobacter postgatei 2ac9 TaxID=879212 RepID=I5B7G8_9BACT|nr:Ig-like domain-containing protein [Desulfobacter postgatei]EIM65431.1 Ig-like domain-containing surface protein [Desulfobacter postgatei 2ac9]
MAGEERINMSTWNSRLNYFDGLFLKAEDFTLEQFFHLMARRYLNYLLFNPGRLYTADGTMPLEVTASGTTITVSSGTALVRYDGDADNRAGHEVHLETSVDLDLSTSTYGFSVGDTVYVRIDYREAEEIVGAGGGGAGVFVASANQVREQAVIKLSTVPPDGLPPDDYSVLLATVDYQAAMTNSNVTNDPTRGGIRYEILSSDLLSRIGTSSGDAVLTGITITPGAEDSILSGGNKSLTATGSYSDGSSHVLSSSTPGLEWSSSDETVATVDSNGVVTGGNDGAVSITVTVDTVSTSVDLSVFTDVSITIEGEFSINIGESSALTAVGEFDNGIIRQLTAAGDGLAWSSNNEAVVTVDNSGVVSAHEAGTAQIQAEVFGSSSASVTITVAPSITRPVFRTTGNEFLPTSVFLSSSPTIEIFCEHFFEGDPNLRRIAIGGITLTVDEMAGIIQTLGGIGSVPMPATLSPGSYHIVLTNEGGPSEQSTRTLNVYS